MKFSRLTHDPAALIELFEQGLTALGAVYERPWHDRLQLIAEGASAKLWNSDGTFIETELIFRPPTPPARARPTKRYSRGARSLFDLPNRYGFRRCHSNELCFDHLILGMCRLRRALRSCGINNLPAVPGGRWERASSRPGIFHFFRSSGVRFKQSISIGRCTASYYRCLKENATSLWLRLLISRKLIPSLKIHLIGPASKTAICDRSCNPLSNKIWPRTLPAFACGSRIIYTANWSVSMATSRLTSGNCINGSRVLKMRTRR